MSLEGTLRQLPLPLTYARVRRAIRATRYDGAVTLHFRGGIEQRIEMGRPYHFELAPDPPAEGEDSTLERPSATRPGTIPLDSR